ncbi:hypothetical protein CNEO2_850004 [Clostridium neonatale]|nr:hypothetical protein CNEO2_1160022 [Clostridium neonatale]CAI3248687.1 hypothetical protein CNEO2_850004 [Clostridium neonatale]
MISEERIMNDNLEDLFELISNKFIKVEGIEDEVENVFKTFVYPQNVDIIDDLINQLQYQFNFSGMEFIQLIVSDRNQLNEKIKYNKILNLINILDRKYGYLIKKNLVSKNKPFMFTELQVNVEPSSSVHTLKIKRADGEKFECDITADGLLNLAGAVSGGINLALNTGIFNLNSVIIENYQNNTENVNEIIDRIISNNVGK